MTLLILFSVVATIMSIEAIRMVLHDGRGPLCPPHSHVEDPQFRAPAAGC